MNLISAVSLNIVENFVNGVTEPLQSFLNSRVNRFFLGAALTLSNLPMASSMSFYFLKRKLYNCTELTAKTLNEREKKMGREYSLQERKEETAKEFEECTKKVAAYNKRYNNFGTFAFVGTVLFIVWHEYRQNRLHENHFRELEERHNRYR